MEISPQEHPVALQLFGSDPDSVSEAAAMIEDRPFDILDFNMGCPVPKVVNNQEGSALMKDPVHAAAILSAVVKKIHKPVTVKIRKGFNDDQVNAVEAARRLEDAGVSAIAIHGRTREQYYAGKADWDIIRQVKEAVSIPVIGNGDVDTPEAARKMLEETGVDGVMIARAARGNPWIFHRVIHFLETGEILPEPDAQEVYQMILRHMELMAECKGAPVAIREMRKHISWYTAGFPNSASLRRRINEAQSYDEVRELLQEILH
ncbi:MAG: tRNA dihydrouridine synthase DusB, partial [Eubacterium sp.]|nr:tRNA dihydrouridine synthase DusB [Eubacterium sp.]